MSEQDNKPTGGQKAPKEKNTLRLHVVLDGGNQGQTSGAPAPRKKVTVTNSALRVKMPGNLKPNTEKKALVSAVKPKLPASKPKKEVSKPVGRKQPSEVSKKPKKAAKPIQPSSRVKASPPKKSVAPTKQKPVARAKVTPPKIGTRHGYRPTLAFRLRFPVFLMAFAVCALALFFAFRKEVGPVGRYVATVKQPSLVEVTIKPGMSAREVSLLLKGLGVVDDEQALMQYFIANNIATIIRSGTFVMERGMDHTAIGKQLTARLGELVLEVSPAFTLEAIDRYLENRGYAKGGEFLKAVEALKKEYSLSFVEGWLLSGEYTVPAKEAPFALAHAMFDAMLTLLQPHLGSERVAQWGVEQTLIIASMIQAETQDIEEMPLIASVIYNRLEAGEPLGIDATTRYELDDWKNPIPKKALETQTPYNTRRKVGLPPSGICSPSKSAVEAALFPLESPYFYYLHGLDKRLHPAITYEEHTRNIRQYR